MKCGEVVLKLPTTYSGLLSSVIQRLYFTDVDIVLTVFLYLVC